VCVRACGVCVCGCACVKWEYNKAVYQFFFGFKKAYDSVRREVVCYIFIEYGVPMILVWLIKMCLTETCNTVRVGKNLSDMFPIGNDLKQRDALSAVLFNLF
jgi:hypothetical protein